MPANNSESVSSALGPDFEEFQLEKSNETPVKKPVKKRTEAEKNATKRSGYLEWEEYFMMSALVASQRSKDPSTQVSPNISFHILQVGVVIVNKHNKIVGTGYNGFPVGCSDDEFPWGKGNDDPLDNKYPYVVHAEANAILNKIGDNLEGTTLYTTTFPCNECAKLIIQSRIRDIVYLNDRDESSYVAAKKMFQSVGITYRQFTLDKEEITITLRPCSS